MIDKFVRVWDERKHEIEAYFKENHPSCYKGIVEQVVKILDDLDVERIHVIDDGDYQGTLLFIIAEQGYQPSRYWAVSVNYGSCSGCDTLQRIQDSGNYNEKPTEKQTSGYMTLALHILQGLKEIEA